MEAIQKKVEAQHEHIKLYEKKLKDVVRAYKSLDAEKRALQQALDAISPSKSDTKDGSSKTEGETVETLKEALATITRETMRKEAAFQSDKKSLQSENNALREKLTSTERHVKILQEKLRQLDVDREKELVDHGKVVSEMQSRYAKEHQSFEAATKESNVLVKQIQQKDETINQLKTREAQLTNQVASLSKEVKELTDKVYHVPSIQILRDELANLKVDHARELSDAVVKAKQKTQQEEQIRNLKKIADLEDQNLDLLKKIARSEEARTEAYDAYLAVEDEKAALAAELAELRMAREYEDTSDVIDRLQVAIVEVRKLEPEFDIAALVGPDPEKIRLQQMCADLQEELEQCKGKLEALSAANTHFPTDSDSSKKETIRHVAEQFQNKIQKLMAVHAKDRAMHEKATRDLHARISELEQREGRLIVDMRREMNSRISEMETEMQKQRTRTLDVIAEKERELEAARSVLVSIRSEQLNNAPADPAQAGKVTLSKRRSSEYKRYLERKYSSGSRKSVDGASLHSSEANTEELLKKDREIQEMRNISHQLDYRLREVEQASLVKELEHHKKTEAMSEEITKLQNKLSLLSSGGETEYLRNIFVQFIQSGDASAKKNILKAMGMALKLSTNEMKAIDSK
ncbi:hypothetical protein Q1695_000688 [Nippostrongylus brasiliensis]|nr:hypothetical protein Q1695_000688 [Nippostrongylus brasiliensis]